MGDGWGDELYEYEVNVPAAYLLTYYFNPSGKAQYTTDDHPVFNISLKWD